MPGQIALRVSEDDPGVAYLMLPDHPGPDAHGVSGKQIRLGDVLDYIGADIYFDLDRDGRLIGIEILA